MSTDSDGDLISISSTEELKTALNEHETEVLKLCVTLQDEVQGDIDFFCVVCVCVCFFFYYYYYILLLSSQHAPLHCIILHARFVLFTFIWLFVVSFS